MIEISAADLSSEHLDKLASVSWRGLWSKPLRIKTFETVTRADGTMIQRMVAFEGGTQITANPYKLKVRIWP